MNVSHDVTYRQVTLKNDYDCIYGMGFWYKSKEEALVFSNALLEYYEIPQGKWKQFKIAFRSVKNSSIKLEYNLSAIIAYNDNALITEIENINEKYVEEIKKTLASYPYVFLVVGYIDEDGKSQVLKGCVHNTSIIFINDNAIVASGNRKYPIDLINELIKDK